MGILNSLTVQIELIYCTPVSFFVNCYSVNCCVSVTKTALRISIIRVNLICYKIHMFTSTVNWHLNESVSAFCSQTIFLSFELHPHYLSTWKELVGEEQAYSKQCDLARS